MLIDHRNERARQKLLEALEISYGESIPAYRPMAPVELHEAHLKRNHGQVIEGVNAMKLALNIPGGNCYGMDLYALNFLYLLNPEATVELNKVLCKFGYTPAGSQ